MNPFEHLARVERLRRDLQQILDDMDSLNDLDSPWWNEEWENWSRRAIDLAARCDAEAFSGGADSIRSLIQQVKKHRPPEIDRS
jgi:hypothetical protein